MTSSSQESQAEFLVEIPPQVSKAEYQRLVQELRNAEGLEAYGQENRGAELAPQIVEVAIFLGTVGTSIDLVTKGIEIIDKKKEAIDRAAKIIHKWLHSGDTKGKEDVLLVSPDDASKKKKLASGEGSEIEELQSN